MFSDRKVLALIPARGGSKGIKGKNIIDLCGKPLIAYTIEVAAKSKYIDDIIVSTDNLEIAEVAKEFGAEVPFMRPAELASDQAKTVDAAIHAIGEMRKLGREYDCMVLLQATQPLRTVEDLDLAIEKYYENSEKSLVSVSLVDDNPILMRTINEKDELVSMLSVSSTCRRQDMPKFYKVNGCIYINKISEMDSTTSFNDNKIPFIMSQEHSVDIDEPKDLVLAKYYLERN